MKNIKVMKKPYTEKELIDIYEKGENYIHGIVAVELSDIINNDLEGFLDILSNKLVDSELLMDINYEVIGNEENLLFIEVAGDISAIMEL